MAVFYPEVLPDDAPAGEKQFYSALQQQLQGNCHVLGGLRLKRPANNGHQPLDKEVDVLVLDPQRGFLVLEIKGGEVFRNTEGWFSRNRHGHTNPIKAPGTQAEHNAHGLWRYLKEHPAYNQSEPPRFAWGVVLPDCDASGIRCPELPREYIIDASDLHDLNSRLAEIFTAREPRARSLSDADCQRFLRCVAPHFDLAPSLASRIRQDERQLVRLTEEQIRILEVLGEQRRVGVKGGAGTGKTLLAMERARRLATEGSRVLFLCFNAPLATHLQEQADNFVVRTFHDLSRHLAEAAGLKWSIPADQEMQKRFWEETTAELMSDAIAMLPQERWDHVVIDEGQDFRELWWLSIEHLLTDRPDTSLWVFFDPNQNLYGGGPIDALGLSAANLALNCRNTRRIAEHTASIINQPARSPESAPIGSPVEVIDCDDEQAMAKALRQTLHRLSHDEELTSDQIIVLSPLSPNKSRIFQKNNYGNFSLVPFPNEPGHNQIRFSTLHRFKGLETDAVILVEVNEQAQYCQATHRYVAASRAKHCLSVLRYRPIEEE